MTDLDEVIANLQTLQESQCAICGDEATLVIDHDHRSGFVRGLLCRSCNTIEGFSLCLMNVEDDIFPCGRCELCLYRASPPTAWIGITVVYKSEVLGPWQPSRQSSKDYETLEKATIQIMQTRYWRHDDS